MAYSNGNQGGSRRDGAHFTQSGRGADQRAASRLRGTPRQDNPYGASARQPLSADPASNRYAHASGYYSSAAVGYDEPRRNRILPALFAIVLIAALGFVVWKFILHPSSFDIYLNGSEVRVNRGDTVATLIESGKVDPAPTPGNLLAVDGSLLTEGAGTAYTATIDDVPAEASAELKLGDHVVIGNGTDLTEESTATTEEIPYENINFEKSAMAYYAGSIHLLLKGQNGIQTTRTGNISGITVSEVTQEPVNGGFRVYTVQTSDPVIALTFDDGPWEGSTSQILDLLQQYGAKATFFTIGNQVAAHADVVRRAADMGCQICTHTWDHADGPGQGVNLTYMTAEQQVEEVTLGYQAIADALGYEPAHIMRAPGGNFYGDLIDTVWPYVDAEIGWNVDTEDWSRPGVDEIYARIMSVTPGEVILMHDGGGDRSQTVEALARALPELVDKGYQFVTVDELLAYGLPD